MTAVSPANAATNVSTTTTVSATFSEALDPTTVSASTFQLFAPGNTLVSGTVTYNSGTASFLPGAALATSTTYTAVITGGNGWGEGYAGNAMTANFTWSFTTATAPPPPGSCPCNIWSAATVPSQVDSGDSSAVELGVRFRSDVDRHHYRHPFLQGFNEYRDTHRQSLDEYGHIAGHCSILRGNCVRLAAGLIQ